MIGLPCIVEKNKGHINLINNLEKPINLKKNQIIGQVRSVICEDELLPYSTMSRLPSNERENAVDNTLAITVDADNLL